MTVDDLMNTASTLSTTDLETLISRLAEMRAHMQPPVTFEPPKPGEGGQDISVQNDPYLSARRHRNGGMRLWMRSGGLGWLVFDLTARHTVFLRDWINASGIQEQSGPDLFSQSGLDGQTPH